MPTNNNTTAGRDDVIAVTEPVEITRLALIAALQRGGWAAHPTNDPARWAASRTTPIVVLALAGDLQWAHLRNLHQLGHATVVVLVNTRDPQACADAIRAGAAAALPRDVTAAQVLAAVAAARSGLITLPASSARHLIVRANIAGITAQEDALLKPRYPGSA